MCGLKLPLSADSILSYMPLVERYTIPGYEPNIFAVREDLGPIIGGNKIKRLVSWCQNKPKPNAIHLLSDYGSGSHLALAKIYEYGIFPALEKVVLHERRVETSPFREMLRGMYVNREGVQIKPIIGIRSWIEYFGFQKKGGLILPIGGSVKCRGLYDPVLNLDLFKTLGEKTVFSIPVGSGNTFSEIYNSVRKKNVGGEFVCPITATSPGIFRIFLKRHQNNNTRFFYPRKKTWEEYLLKSSWFEKFTNIQLDPIHGIYLLDVLEKFKKSEINLVFWITSPKFVGLRN